MMRVSERAMWFTEGSAWTFPPIPVEDELVRDQYTVRVSTAGEPYPVVQVRAVGNGGAELEIWAPGARWRVAEAAPAGAERGDIGFEVRRSGDVIGSESLPFRVRSRSFACECDLP